MGAVAMLLSACHYLQPLDKPGMERQVAVPDTVKVLAYGYTEHGAIAGPVCQYRISADSYDAETCLLEYYNHDAHQTDSVECPISLLRSVENLVNEYNICHYEADYNDPDVLDGYSWDIEIQISNYVNYEHFYSHGNNARPKNDGWLMIKQLLEKQIQK